MSSTSQEVRSAIHKALTQQIPGNQEGDCVVELLARKMVSDAYRDSKITLKIFSMLLDQRYHADISTQENHKDLSDEEAQILRDSLARAWEAGETGTAEEDE